METASTLYRVKRFWPFVLLSGLLHIYLGYLYLVTELPRYIWLTRIFIVATVAIGLSEIIFYRIRYGEISEKRLPASLYDIGLGAVLYFFPFYTLVIFPFFVAGGLFVRAITDLLITARGDSEHILGSLAVKHLAWVRILLALSILIYQVIDPQNLWLTGISFGLAGLILIFNAIKLSVLNPKSMRST